MSNPVDDVNANPFEVAKQAAAVIAEKSGVAKHDIALTLGSGWAKAADLIGDRLRTLEHRLQMVADQQTHAVPADPAALDNVARLDGLADGAALGAQAGEARLSEVIRSGGFAKVRRATEGPFNMVLEAR